LLRQDTRLIRGDLGTLEDKVEILSGMSVRVDGTAQEVSGPRRVFDRLDERRRKLEGQMPSPAGPNQADLRNFAKPPTGRLFYSE
jgi:hypothetical protein